MRPSVTVSLYTKVVIFMALSMIHYKKGGKQSKNGQYVYGGLGRQPRLLQDVDKEQFLKALKTDNYKSRSEDANDLLMKCLNDSRKRHGLLGPATITSITKNSIYKNIGLQAKNAEVTTDARAKACADIVNFITFASMNYLFVEMYKVKSQLILNIDATQFNVRNIEHQIKSALSLKLANYKRK